MDFDVIPDGASPDDDLDWLLQLGPAPLQQVPQYGGDTTFQPAQYPTITRQSDQMLRQQFDDHMQGPQLRQPINNNHVQPPLRQPTNSHVQLPQSVINQGYTARDFDPTTPWPVDKFNPNLYRDYPDDLQEQQILTGNPNNIARGNLLRLLMKYTNSQIFDLANGGRPEPVFKSKATVTSRVNGAIEAEMKKSGRSRADVEAWLDGQRVKSGIGARVHKRKRDDQVQAFGLVAADRLIAQPAKRRKMDGQVQQPFHQMQVPPTTPQQPSHAIPSGYAATISPYLQPPAPTITHYQQPTPTPSAASPPEAEGTPSRGPNKYPSPPDPYGIRGAFYHNRVKGGRSEPSSTATPDAKNKWAPVTPASSTGSAGSPGSGSEVIDLTDEDDEDEVL